MNITRRDALVLSAGAVALAAAVAAPAVAASVADNYAHMLQRHLLRYGVETLFNPDNDSIVREGAKIGIHSSSGSLLWQRHVDCVALPHDVPSNINVRLRLLARSIVRQVAPATKIRTFHLWLPPEMLARRIESNNVTLRTMRDGAIDRIDVLFSAEA